MLPERLVLRGVALRPEQDAHRAPDRRHRALVPLRRQPDDPRRDNALRPGGRRRQDALPLLRRQAAGRRRRGRGPRRDGPRLVDAAPGPPAQRRRAGAARQRERPLAVPRLIRLDDGRQAEDVREAAAHRHRRRRGLVLSGPVRGCRFGERRGY